MRAHVIVIHVNDDAVYLADENDGAMSITNDAEAVTMWTNNLYPDRRIYYRDTEGNWDELVHKNGVFVGFNLLSRPAAL
jgi:predicted double-glycine peptidase